uniref:Glycosyltransferase family 92 protein n=1 Tax=Panagrolaimus sp. PS1159 TaxID=55785 RepID=A0AC35FJH6_9BILA
MADCVYRSRSETKYLIMTDLDEIIYIKSGKTIKKFIQTKATQNISAFWFSSAKIIGKSNLTLIWKYLEKPIQSKLIINTQLTKTINVHTPGESEVSSKNNIVDIHPNEAVIVHSRFDYENANGSINSNILSMKGLLKLQSNLDFHVKKIYKILKIPYSKSF